MILRYTSWLCTIHGDSTLYLVILHNTRWFCTVSLHYIQWFCTIPSAHKQYAVILHYLSQSSGDVWKARWPSWAPVPNKPTVSVEVKQRSAICTTPSDTKWCCTIPSDTQWFCTYRVIPSDFALCRVIPSDSALYPGQLIHCFRKLHGHVLCLYCNVLAS